MRPTGAAVWREPLPESVLEGVAALSVLLIRVVVAPVASVEPPAVSVDAVVTMVDSDAEPLPVADTDSVSEPLVATEVEKMVLVARVVVATDPSLLVRVATISVVEMGTKTPSVPEVSLEPLDRVVVPIVVGTGEPSLFVTVEMISDSVTEAVPEPEPLAPVAAVAKTVAVGDEAMAGS